MMTVLKNRKIAVLITIVVVALTTLISVNRSLMRLSRDIERMFYDGVYLESDGYTQPGIDSQIKKHAEATLGLATTLTNYPELGDRADEVLRSRRELLDAGSISDKSICFWAMSRNVHSLIQAASDISLTERDMEAVSSYSATITGAEEFIKGSAYNQAVLLRWNEQSSIARIICALVPAREPAAF